MIIKNLPDTEEREEEEKRWKKKTIYILKIFIAMFDRWEVEHILFIILSNVCHRLSSACSTLAIVSSFDNVRAFDDVSLLMTNKIFVTFFSLLNSLIWFLIHSRRFRLIWIFFVKILHYFLCILKSLRIISRFIFVMIFSLD